MFLAFSISASCIRLDSNRLMGVEYYFLAAGHSKGRVCGESGVRMMVETGLFVQCMELGFGLDILFYVELLWTET